MRGSDHRPYQGYPYINPPVNDAPSIDSETAARWNHLPRKQIELPVRTNDPVVFVGNPDGDGESRNEALIRQGRLPLKPAPEDGPVVYIDMPESSGSHVSNERYDEPGASSSSQPKREPDDEPIVYIDLPDASGNDVTTTPHNEEPEFVQETIFFNPFENRRIETNKSESRIDSESEDESIASGHSYRRPLPSTQNLYGAGSSGSSTQPPTATTGLPPSMTKETMMYQGTDERFPMSPIPVSEFPEPPPAYAEIDRVSSPVVDTQEPTVEQPIREEGPRTQGILPREQPITPMGLPNQDRKYLNCHHCGMRVHTLVIRENGTITHAIALLCLLICMLPVVVFIYCTDYLKIKNHYCPNCNKIIGYELPLSGNKIIYVN